MATTQAERYQGTLDLPRRSEGASNGAGSGTVERLASVAGGTALAYYALRSRPLPGALLALAGGALVYRGATGHWPAADSRERGAEPGVRVERAVTINTSPEELYAFWRRLENLPRFMDHLVSVSELDARRSHWVAKAPMGRTVEWDAEITAEEPGRRLAWRSLPGAEIENAGEVRFQPAPAGRGMELHVTLSYQPPAGTVGALVARLLGEEPERQVADDLRRLKAMLEAGEIPTTEGQTSGRKEMSR